MKKYLSTFIFTFSVLFLSAQSSVIPLEVNTVLKNQTVQEEQKRASLLAELPVFYVEKQVVNRGGVTRSDSVYSGKKVRIEIDTIGLKGGSINILNASNLKYGTVSLAGDELDFVANTDVKLGFDTIQVELKKNDNTLYKSLTYEVVVRRGVTLRPFADLVLLPDENRKVCLPLDSLVGAFSKIQIGSIFNKSLAEILKPTTLSNCFYVKANRFSGSELLETKVCDQYGICDSFAIRFSIKQDTINPPFYDDFSGAGPYPNPKLWLDDDTYVNYSFAWNPTSLGVVTFDGVDKKGVPYGGTIRNWADTLTSTYLNTTTASKYYLSIILQPKGTGDWPSFSDSLILQFKKPSGVWQTVMSFRGLFGPDLTAWKTDSIRILEVPAEYNFKGFQFRFINNNIRKGVLALWHLDYISLTDIPATQNFKDIAFTQLPTPLTKNYTAIPWRHLRESLATELSDSISIQLYNRFGVVKTANPSSFTIDETATGSNIHQYTLLEIPPITKQDQRSIPAGRSAFKNPIFGNNIVSKIQGSPFWSADTAVFVTNYSFDQSDEINEGIPTHLKNNKASILTNCTNYFSYDDGVAEAAFAIKNTTDKVALKFTSFIPDTLRAVQLMIPHTLENITNIEFNLMVWTDLTKGPIYTGRFRPFYIDHAYDSLQGFTTYVLQDSKGNRTPVGLPKGDFYVGWQQLVSSTQFGIGFDYNSLLGNSNLFITSSGVFKKNEAFKGTLMIRPIVGSKTPFHTPSNSSEIVEHSDFKLFPNPTTGNVQVSYSGDLKPTYIIVYDFQGKMIEKVIYQENMNLNFSLQGNYMISLWNEDGRIISTKKLVVVK